MMGKDGWELKKVYSLESGSIDIPFSMRQIHVFERCTFTDEPKETVDKQT